MHMLIIKGSMSEAFAALDAHKVEALSIVQHAKFPECIVTVAATTPWETLAQWFCAKGTLPFPAGTLLWYGPAIASPIMPAPKGWDKVEGGTEQSHG